MGWSFDEREGCGKLVGLKWVKLKIFMVFAYCLKRSTRTRGDLGEGMELREVYGGSGYFRSSGVMLGGRFF